MKSIKLLVAILFVYGLGGACGGDSPVDETPTDVAGALDGLRWELPCVTDSDPTVCTTPGAEVLTAKLEGAAGTSYDVMLRFRGVVEERTYTGGTNDGHFWQVGGDEPSASDPFNIYRLDVSSPAQTYFLNRGESDQRFCDRIDYTETIRVDAGATLTLTADPVDGSREEIKNLDTQTPQQPLVVPGVPPGPQAFNGQFVQMDVVSVTPRSI